VSRAVKDRAPVQRAFKACLGLCVEETSGFVGGAKYADLVDGHYAYASLTLPDGTRMFVSLSVHLRLPAEDSPPPQKPPPLLLKAPPPRRLSGPIR